jgi:hypothetical protein
VYFADSSFQSPRAREAFEQLQRGRADLAEPLLRAWAAAEPHHPAARGLLGVCVALLGRGEESLREAEAAVRLAPEWDGAHGLLATVHLLRERPVPAERAAREALARAPDDVEHHALLAAALLGQGLRRDAYEAAEAGLRLDPLHPGCTRVRVHALLLLGRAAEAEGAAAAALARHRGDAELLGLHAWALLAQGERAQAEKQAQEALRRGGGGAYARLVLEQARTVHDPLWRTLVAVTDEYLDWGPLVLLPLAFASAAAIAIVGDDAPGVVWLAFLPHLVAAVFTVLGLVLSGFYDSARRGRLRGPDALRPEEQARARGIAAALMLGSTGVAAAAVAGGLRWTAVAVLAALLSIPVRAVAEASGEGEWDFATAWLVLATVAALLASGAWLFAPLPAPLRALALLAAAAVSLPAGVLARRAGRRKREVSAAAALVRDDLSR